MSEYLDVSVLTGKIFESVDGDGGSHRLIFRTTDGDTYMMFREQDCCKSVWLADVFGDPQDLVGTPVLEAWEETNVTDTPPEDASIDDSRTWTFYHFQTAKGHVVVRWVDVLNCYYSESMKLVRMD